MELRFPFELGRDVSCVLQLTNRSGDFVTFAVKANQSKYRTVPGRGVMPPCSKRYVVATLQAAQGSPPAASMECDDLFIVRSVTVVTSDGGSSSMADNVAEDCLEKGMGGTVDEVRLPAGCLCGTASALNTKPEHLESD